MPPEIPPASRAANQLRGMIDRGELTPGTVLHLAALTRQVGASRYHVGVAVELLVAEGIIRYEGSRYNRRAMVS